MVGPLGISILVVDDDPCVIEDYRAILCPIRAPLNQSARWASPLEDELFGKVLAHDGFPQVDLTAVRRGDDALESVRQSLDKRRPFAVAFIDVNLPPGHRGLDAAEDIRALDPDVQIVLVATWCDVHPVDICARIPPADRVFLVRKPFHAAEIQQLVLGLSSRWRAERAAASTGLPDWRGLSRALSHAPAGVVIYDHWARLVSASPPIATLFPELAETFVPGTSYAEVQRRLDRHAILSSVGMSPEDWPHDRPAASPESGAAWELELRGGRSILAIQGEAAGGEICCLYFDITSLKRRDAERARAAHQAEMVRAYAALYEELKAELGRDGAEAEHASVRSADSNVAPFPCGPKRGSIETYLHTLMRGLEAVAGPPGAVPDGVRLDLLIAEIVERMRSELRAGAEIEIVAGAGLWPVRFDARGFEVALSELSRNAFAAMPGEGRLTLQTSNARIERATHSLHGGHNAGDYVRVSVQDTGAGLSGGRSGNGGKGDSIPDRISSRPGLGLCLAHGFAVRSGGYVEIESTLGRGTTVDIYLPRADVARAGARLPRHRDAFGATAGNSAIGDRSGE